LEIAKLRRSAKWASLGSADSRVAYREELKAYLRGRQNELAPSVRERIDLNPMRAFDSDDPGTRQVMDEAPTMLERLSEDDAEHFNAVRAV
jgi:histidyl-tRNA synthetase